MRPPNQPFEGPLHFMTRLWFNASIISNPDADDQSRLGLQCVGYLPDIEEFRRATASRFSFLPDPTW